MLLLIRVLTAHLESIAVILLLLETARLELTLLEEAIA